MKRIFLAAVLLFGNQVAFAGQPPVTGPSVLNALSASTSVIPQESGGSSVNPKSLRSWNACKAGVLSGYSNCRIVYMGDSTVQSAEISTYGDSQQNVTYWLSLFLNNAGITANQNSFCGDGGTVARTTSDARITGGEWVKSSITTLGGNPFQTNAVGSDFVFAPGVAVDTFNVLYIGNATSTASFTATATGGTAVTASGSQSSGMYTATATAASLSSSNTLTIDYNGSGGYSYFSCVEAYNSAVKSVNIFNAGVFAASNSSWVGNTNPWDTLHVLETLNPRLTIIESGINEPTISMPISTYTANLQSIISAAQISGSVILVTGNNATSHVSTPYFAAARALAAADNIPVVSVDIRFGSYSGAQGTTPPLIGPDGIHPTPYGAYDIAWAVAQALLK